MPELTPEQKAQLDRNIRNMLAQGATEQDVIAYTNDFKAKYEVSVKKKEDGVGVLESSASRSQSLLPGFNRYGQPEVAGTLAGSSPEVSRNPYGGIFELATGAGLDDSQSSDLYRQATSGNLQPVIDLVKSEKEKLNAKKQEHSAKKKQATSNDLTGASDLIMATQIPENDITFQQDDDRIKKMQTSAASVIDKVMSDKFLSLKGQEDFYSAKQIGDERRKLRSEVGEEIGYTDEVGDIAAVDKLKNKFHYGIDLPTKALQTKQIHDYLNELGIYKTSIEALLDEAESLSKTPAVEEYLKLRDEYDKAPSEQLFDRLTTLESDSGVNDFIRKVTRARNYGDRIEQLSRSYPAVGVEIERQQLADAWAKKVMVEDAIADVTQTQTLRQLRKIFVGDKPNSQEDYEELSQATGIPVERVKQFIEIEGDASSVGIPSRLGRVLRSATGVVGSTIEGINRLTYDRNEANVINKHLDKIKYKPAEPLTKEWNVDRVIDTMADGLGQFGGYVVGAELLGLPFAGAGAAAEGVGVAAQIGQSSRLLSSVPKIIKGIEKAKSIGGTFATGYLSSYEDAYQYAATQTDDESERQSYASSVAKANGFSELILRDVDVAGKILRGKNADDIINRFASSRTPFTTGDVFKARLGEFAKVIGYESLEELVPYFTEVFQKDNVFGNKMSASEIYNGALETIVQTAISTVPMGGFSTLSVPTKSVFENALLEAAKTPDRFNARWNEMFEKGLISEQQKNKNIKVVNTVADIYAKIPDQLPDGRTLSDSEKGKLINSILGKRQLEDLKENTDPAFHGTIDEKVKEKESEIGEIINKTPLTNEQEKLSDIPATEAAQEKTLFERAQESASEGVKLLIGETETTEGLRALNEQALDTPNGLLSGLNNNRELVTDIISQNPEEQINKSIDRWTDAIANDTATPEEGDAHISLLEEGLAKKQAPTKKGKTTSQEIEAVTITKEAEDLLASISDGSKPAFITKNLERIAKENGIEVTGDMSADDVINALREKQTPASQLPKGEEQKVEPVAQPATGPAVIPPSSVPQNVTTRKGVTVVTAKTEMDKFVERMAKGEALSTPEDLQFYENNATEIESRLRDKLKQEAKEEVEIPTPEEQERTRISDALFAFADKILKADPTGSGGGAAMTNLFKIPQEILGRAIQAVAVAVKGGELFTDAIKKGIDIIRGAGHQVDEDDFTGLVNSLSRGEKPKAGKVRARSIAIDAAVPSDKEYSQAMDGNEPADPIAAYHMTRAPEVAKMFGADKTQQNVFDSLPSEERFRAQMEMLQDGKALMAAAQSMFGSTDVNVYGRRLFRYIHDMPGVDAGLTNKRAVMLATLLGEIKQAVLTNKNPDIQGELQQLDRAVGAYYNKFMHVTAKNLSAARLLRLFRDKYMADIFHDKILEEQQIKERNAMTEDEADTEISDEDALAHQEKPRQKPDIKDQQKKRTQKQAKADQRKRSPKNEFDRIASEKEDDIKKKYGGKNKLIETIIEKIKKLNCK